MKQTAPLYLKLPFKPAFLVFFCYFGKVKSLFVLNLFVSEYLDKIFPWNKKGVDIFSKAPGWKPLFLLKVKSKTQNAKTRNTIQSSSTFIRISGPILEVRKFALKKGYENIIAYSEESKQSEV